MRGSVLKMAFLFFALGLLPACQGVGMSGSEVALPPVGGDSGSTKVASNDGVLGSQSASQDVTKNFAVNLRFPGETLEKSSDISPLLYLSKSGQNVFPSALLEKIILYPEFKHEACCEGRVLRVVDLGNLPLADGTTAQDRTYHTFTKLLTGDLEIQDLNQIRYRDYVIGSPDELGQNVKWDDLPLKADNFYSFFLMPEGQVPQTDWKAFPSQEALFQMYVDKALQKVRDLRVLTGIKLTKPMGLTELTVDENEAGLD